MELIQFADQRTPAAMLALLMSESQLHDFYNDLFIMVKTLSVAITPFTNYFFALTSIYLQAIFPEGFQPYETILGDYRLWFEDLLVVVMNKNRFDRLFIFYMKTNSWQFTKRRQFYYLKINVLGNKKGCKYHKIFIIYTYKIFIVDTGLLSKVILPNVEHG
jgi:hypothetical protein